MKFETPELDESKNPNISHEPLSWDLWRMLGYLALSIMVIVLLVEIMVRSLPYVISLEYEQNLLGTLAQSMIVSTNDDNAVRKNQDLQRIADDLAVIMGLPENIIQVYINPDNDINAYATFGGHIVMYQGLLNRLPSEEAVIAVLAHEMAHVQHRDVLRSSSRGLLLTSIITSLTGNMGVLSVIHLESLRYSRYLEDKADEKAIHVLHQYYGSVGGVIQAFQMFNALENEKMMPNALGWISSHPKILERLQQIYNIAQENGYALTFGIRENRWKAHAEK